MAAQDPIHQKLNSTEHALVLMVGEGSRLAGGAVVSSLPAPIVSNI